MKRRGFFAALGALLAAPIVARFVPESALKILGVDMATEKSMSGFALMMKHAPSRYYALVSYLEGNESFIKRVPVDWRGECRYFHDGDGVYLGGLTREQTELLHLPAGAMITGVTLEVAEDLTTRNQRQHERQPQE